MMDSNDTSGATTTTTMVTDCLTGQNVAPTTIDPELANRRSGTSERID